MSPMADDTRRLPKTRAARRIHREAFHVKGCKGCPMNDALVAVEDEAARAALAAAETPGPREHPGEPHNFEALCRRCGQPGMANLTILAPDEIIVIRTLAAALPSTDTEEHPDGR